MRTDGAAVDIVRKEQRGYAVTWWEVVNFLATETAVTCYVTNPSWVAGQGGSKLRPMCAQCMMGATTAAVGVTGIRAWLGAQGFSWLTPRRMRFTTISLVVAGLIGASVSIGGT